MQPMTKMSVEIVFVSMKYSMNAKAAAMRKLIVSVFLTPMRYAMIPENTVAIADPTPNMMWL